MRDNRFKDARRLAKRIEYEGSGNKGEYYVFKFGDGSQIPITLIRQDSGTEINCKCKHCSITNNQYICSYKVALILYKAGFK